GLVRMVGPGDIGGQVTDRFTTASRLADGDRSGLVGA
ncbi:MAG: hypothetical protein ACI9WU_001545, partial [Myxococcota bacterium]